MLAFSDLPSYVGQQEAQKKRDGGTIMKCMIVIPISAMFILARQNSYITTMQPEQPL